MQVNRNLDKYLQVLSSVIKCVRTEVYASVVCTEHDEVSDFLPVNLLTVCWRTGVGHALPGQ